MNKKLIVLTALMLATSAQGMIALDASAIPGEFETMWAMDLPRVTYFIGESVTFTVVAFASTDPTLMLPDQMAKITIRNDSLAEVYEAWITTNVNGSAPVTWETGLEASAGNYTIILDDLKGEKVVEHFVLLFNEETYWQVKVGLIERELESQYQYINYLFSFQNYQQKRINELYRIVMMSFVALFMTLFIALWTWFPELAKRARGGKGVYDQLGKGLAAMGITSEPRIYLDHEEVSQISVPADKAAPRFNAENYCEVCDKAHEKPLTLVALEDHAEIHDRSYLRRPFWRARRRERVRENEANAHIPEKKPEPTYGTVKEYSDDWEYKQKVKELKTRVKGLKKLYDKKKISEAVLKTEMKKVREEVDRLNKIPSKETETKTEPPKNIPKPASAPKTELQRKVRMERQLSSPKNASAGIPEKIIPKVIPPIQRTKIDELFDELSNEKVN
jgi:hypothetical protein